MTDTSPTFRSKFFHSHKIFCNNWPINSKPEVHRRKYSNNQIYGRFSSFPCSFLELGLFCKATELFTSFPKMEKLICVQLAKPQCGRNDWVNTGMPSEVNGPYESKIYLLCNFPNIYSQQLWKGIALGAARQLKGSKYTTWQGFIVRKRIIQKRFSLADRTGNVDCYWNGNQLFFYGFKVCLHVPTPFPSPSQCLSKFNILLMVTGSLTGRMVMGTGSERVNNAFT